jgi:hypothetical protein
MEKKEICKILKTIRGDGWKILKNPQKVFILKENEKNGNIKNPTFQINNKDKNNNNFYFNCYFNNNFVKLFQNIINRNLIKKQNLILKNKSLYEKITIDEAFQIIGIITKCNQIKCYENNKIRECFQKIQKKFDIKFGVSRFESI